MNRMSADDWQCWLLGIVLLVSIHEQVLWSVLLSLALWFLEITPLDCCNGDSGAFSVMQACYASTVMSRFYGIKMPGPACGHGGKKA